MKKRKLITAALLKYEMAEKKLCEADNNLRFIKAVKSMLFWLNRFDSLLTDEQRRDGEFSAIYQALFTSCCGFSTFERLQNTILDYTYGNKPFSHV